MTPLHPPDDEPVSDAALLREFAEEGDHAAFTEMVRRHRGLVLSTALRITRDHTLAEEASQNVFAILARKAAPVAQYGDPGAWLHRTTVFEAKKRLRTEIRHRSKLAALVASTDSMIDPNNSDSSLTPLLPHVDECIQRLRPAEQQAIRMRYLEGRSYDEIAAALGKSGEAGKKHTARALERLCAMLRRRGVVTTAVLAAGLRAGSQTASAGSAESLATAALGTARGLTDSQLLLHTLCLMNAKKATAATVVLLLVFCAVPLWWQERAIAAQADAKLADAGNPVSVTVRKDLPSPEAVSSRLRAALETLSGQGDAPAVTLEVIADVANAHGGLQGNNLEAQQQISALELAELRGFFDEAASLPDERRGLTQLMLLGLIGKKDPAEGIRCGLPLCKTIGGELYGGPQPTSLLNTLGEIYGQWLQQDHRAALASYETLRDSGGFDGKGIGETGELLAERIAGSCYAVSSQDSIRLFSALKGVSRVNALARIAEQAHPEDRGFVMAEADRFEGGSPGHSFRSHVIHALLRGEAEREGADAGAALADELGFRGAERVMAFATLLHEAAKDGSKMDDRQGLQWATRYLSGEDLAQAGGQFLSYLHPNDEEAFEALRAFDWDGHRDAAIAALLRRMSLFRDMEAAGKLALEVEDHALSVELMRHIATTKPPLWRAPGFTARIASDASLTNEERRHILAP